MRDIGVSAVANGWIVTVGCQRFVYDEVAKLVADFQSYLTDPEGTEKRIMAAAVNAKHTVGVGNPAPPRGYVGGQDAANIPCCESSASTFYPESALR